MATPSTIARGRNVVHGLQHQTQQPWTNTHAAASQFAASPRCVCQVLGRVPPEDAANKNATLPRPSCRQFRGRHRCQALLHACTVSCHGLACRHNCNSHACRLTLIAGCWRSCRRHQHSCCCCCAPDRAVRRQGQRCYQREIYVRHTPAAAAPAPATCI